MKWIEVRAEYQEKEGFLVAELVADAFFETGFSGVAVYDGRIKTEDDWADGVLPEDGPPHVDGYFPEDGGFSRRFSDLEKRLAKLERDTGIRIRIAAAPPGRIRMGRGLEAAFSSHAHRKSFGGQTHLGRI